MNPRNFGAAGGMGSLGAGLAGLFGGNGNNPYDQASKSYNQIPGTLNPIYQPYMQAGQGAMGQLQGAYGQMMNDPNGVMNRIGSGYQKSPGYDWQLNQGMNAANNAAASGGMAGSPQHQQQASTMATGLANQDYYNYLNHALGIYGQGTQGMGDIMHQGYNASNELAGGLGSNLMNQGNLAYQSQNYQNQQQANSWGDIFGGLASMAPMMFGA